MADKVGFPALEALIARFEDLQALAVHEGFDKPEDHELVTGARDETKREIRRIATALHEAFEGPAGIGNELNCYSCATWPDDNTPGYDPKPGDPCYELAAATLACLECEALHSVDNG